MFSKIKIVLILILLILCGIIYFMSCRIKSLNNDLSLSYENIKAYSSESSIYKEESRVFKLSLEQLRYYNDSILIEINKVKDTLKIKDKQLKSLQYISSTTYSKDTLRLVDTIFNEVSFKLDTIIRDDWKSIKLKLEYPNFIGVESMFKSDKYIITHTTKETIKPPKKFFVSRWLQKKQLVTIVDVYEKSPYIENNKQRFIEIIK